MRDDGVTREERPDFGPRFCQARVRGIRQPGQRLNHRRQAAREAGDIDSIETAIEGELRGFGEESLAVTVEALSPESTTAKPCPKCFASTPVKTQTAYVLLRRRARVPFSAARRR